MAADENANFFLFRRLPLAARARSTRPSNRNANPHRGCFDEGPMPCIRVPASPRRECIHGSFIDLGGNRGDTLAAFYASDNRGHGLFGPLLAVLGAERDPHAFCATTFEANPKWTQSLLAVANDHRHNLSLHGGAVDVCHTMAVTGDDSLGSSTTLYIDPTRNSGGTSSTPTYCSLRLPFVKAIARPSVQSRLAWLSN